MQNLRAVLITTVKRLLGDLPGGPSDGVFLLLRGLIDFSARVAGVALITLWTVVLVRLLGADNYGHYVYVMSITFFVSLLGGLGLPTVSTYYVSRYRRTRRFNHLHAFLWTAAMVCIVGSTVGALAVWLVLTLSGSDTFAPFSLITVIAFSVGAALVQLFAFTARAIEKTTAAGYGEQVLQRIFAFIGIGILLLAGWSISPNSALTANVVGSLGAAGFMLFVIRTVIGPPPQRSAGLWKQCLVLAPRWIRRATTMMITPVYFLVLSETDILMLGAFAPLSEVGIYHVARRLAGFMSFFSTAVITVGLHRFVSAHMEHDTRRLEALVRTMGLLGGLPAVLLWGLFLIAGPWLLDLFGPEMVAGHAVLMILATTRLFDIAMGPTTELLMMTGYEKPVSRINILFAGVNIGLNAVMVPLFGMEGAAIATALAMLPWKVTLVVLAVRHLDVAPTVVPLPAAAIRWIKS